jgi:adenosylcobinamide-phosphate synthase
MVAAAAMLLAWLLDAAFGEPRRWHPVSGMGRLLAAGGRWARAPGPDLARFWAGALIWCGLAALIVIAAAAAQQAVLLLPAWQQALALALLLKPLFAWRMLRDEVAAVEAALAEGIGPGRARLARLVSRDVSQLDAVAVRESAIESLAENLNDSVVAPLFWFAVAGLPGAALYRLANTADALWGYRGHPWEWAGKWAAWADDVLSWLPARIAALAIALQRPRVLRVLPAEARRTPSPNGGWPMGAMALLLGVRLGKPGVYTLNAPGRAATPQDTARALRCAGRAAMGALLVTAATLAAR